MSFFSIKFIGTPFRGSITSLHAYLPHCPDIAFTIFVRMVDTTIVPMVRGYFKPVLNYTRILRFISFCCELKVYFTANISEVHSLSFPINNQKVNRYGMNELMAQLVAH